MVSSRLEAFVLRPLRAKLLLVDRRLRNSSAAATELVRSSISLDPVPNDNGQLFVTHCAGVNLRPDSPVGLCPKNLFPLSVLESSGPIVALQAIPAA
jgi:hypothetical protein